MENSALKQLAELNFGLAGPFMIVVSWEENFEFVKETLKGKENYWLHVSTQKADGCIAIEDFNPDVLLTYVRLRINELKAKKYPDDGFIKICSSLISGKPPQRRSSQLDWKGHNITRPNENALIAIGYDLERKDETLSPGNEENAHRWIYAAFREVSNKRDSLSGKNNPQIANALCIFLPATLKKADTVTYLTQLTGEGISVAARKCISQYLKSSNIIPTLQVEEKSILNDPHFQATMAIRSAELRFTTTIVSRIICSGLTTSTTCALTGCIERRIA